MGVAVTLQIEEDNVLVGEPHHTRLLSPHRLQPPVGEVGITPNMGYDQSGGNNNMNPTHLYLKRKE
jgi:hypothetical protein